MEELTRQNIQSFLEQFRRKLKGRTFTFHSASGHVHESIRPEDLTISGIRVDEDGTWNIDLQMGDVGLTLGTFFETPESDPVVWNVNTGRLWYFFTENSVRIRSKVINPAYAWEGWLLFVIQE